MSFTMLQYAQLIEWLDGQRESRPVPDHLKAVYDDAIQRAALGRVAKAMEEAYEKYEAFDAAYFEFEAGQWYRIEYKMDFQIEWHEAQGQCQKSIHTCYGDLEFSGGSQYRLLCLSRSEIRFAEPCDAPEKPFIRRISETYS